MKLAISPYLAKQHPCLTAQDIAFLKEEIKKELAERGLTEPVDTKTRHEISDKVFRALLASVGVGSN